MLKLKTINVKPSNVVKKASSTVKTTITAKDVLSITKTELLLKII